MGVAEYLGFNANSISLTGSTEGITIGGKGKRVGGAFGEAIGGSISSVTVTNLNNISGENNSTIIASGKNSQAAGRDIVNGN